MWALIKRIVKDRRGSVIAYCAISIGLLWMMVAMYPSISEQADEFSKLIDSYPEAFLSAFGIEPDSILFDTLESFTALEYYSLIWPLIAIILGVSFGSWTIAGEIDAGTMELMLAQPVSRATQYISKYISGVSVIAIFTVVTVFSVVPLSWMHNVDVHIEAHVAVALIGSIMTLAVFSISMFFSSIFSERGKASSISAGIIVIMYALNIVSALKENLENLQYLSFFYYFDYAAALKDAAVDVTSVAVFLGVSIMSFIGGLLIFSRRDVAV